MHLFLAEFIAGSYTLDHVGAASVPSNTCRTARSLKITAVIQMKLHNEAMICYVLHNCIKRLRIFAMSWNIVPQDVSLCILKKLAAIIIIKI